MARRMFVAVIRFTTSPSESSVSPSSSPAGVGNGRLPVSGSFGGKLTSRPSTFTCSTVEPQRSVGLRSTLKDFTTSSGGTSVRPRWRTERFSAYRRRGTQLNLTLPSSTSLSSDSLSVETTQSRSRGSSCRALITMPTPAAMMIAIRMPMTTRARLLILVCRARARLRSCHRAPAWPVGRPPCL